MTAFIKRHRLWQVALGLMLAFTLYWGFAAADRYVSEAHVLMENVRPPRLAQSDLVQLLSGSAPNGKELLQLRDYLMSPDMLAKLDAKLDLRSHFSSSYDVFSRMWAKSISLEWFVRHYRSRIAVDYDDYAGVLVVRAQAYTPQMAQAIASAMVAEGERFMNELARRLASEQVEFAEREAAKAAARVAESRQALVAFQNRRGMVSPRGAVESRSAVVAGLEAELSAVQTRRRALESYLAPDAPDLVQAAAQVRALEQQLVAERGRLASPGGKTLNVVTEEYERMQFQTEFNQEVYRTALAALEQARIEATRTLRKVSVLQAPGMPEYPLEPRRIYSITLYILATLLMTGIAHLLLAIVREHRE